MPETPEVVGVVEVEVVEVAGVKVEVIKAEAEETDMPTKLVEAMGEAIKRTMIGLIPKYGMP